MVGSSGLEPPTSRLSGVRSNHLSYEPILTLRTIHPRAAQLSLLLPGASCVQLQAGGGDEGNRTPDPLLAGQVLSHLSYTPV